MLAQETCASTPLATSDPKSFNIALPGLPVSGVVILGRTADGSDMVEAEGPGCNSSTIRERT